jgi:hypothetical protein
MTYEVAKELKGAGFPFSERWTITEAFGATVQTKEGTQQVPTLSYLLEACGDEFEGIQHGVMTEDDGSRLWYAATYDNKVVERGPTPEEAVARLWLALNKND